MSDKGHAVWQQPDDSHPLLRIRDDDTIKARFRKVAIDSGYPDMPGSALKVAVRLHLNMNKNGEVTFQASERELARATKLDKKAARDGVKFLEAEGLLDRTNMGRGKRGKFKVGPRLVNLIDGQTAIDGYSDKARTALLFGAVDAKTNCPEKGGTTAPKKGALCPENRGSHPSPLLSPSVADCSSSPPVVDQTPTTEGSLTSLPHITSLPAIDLNRAPRPPVVSATVKTHVAPATTSSRVAGGTDAYGYGTPIAGIDDANAWVDRFAKIDGPLVADKTPYWVTLKDVARQTSPRRAQAAVLDLEAAKGASKLKSPPLRVLGAWARNIAEDEAARKLEAAASRPKFRLIDHMSGGHRR